MLARLRERFPAWSVRLEHGMWRASGRLLLSASSAELLEAAMNGEPRIPDDLAARRVQVRAERKRRLR